eukprot:6071898-Prymnesium_polylepis.1
MQRSSPPTGSRAVDIRERIRARVALSSNPTRGRHATHPPSRGRCTHKNHCDHAAPLPRRYLFFEGWRVYSMIVSVRKMVIPIGAATCSTGRGARPHI